MIPSSFTYKRAGSAEEACDLAAEYGEEAKYLAGGHSLLPLMKLRLAAPEVIIDLGGLRDLSYITDQGSHVAIGALTRHHDVEHSGLLARELPLLAHAAGEVGDPQIRHRGTIGGSVAHADPASDLPAVLLALDATLVARGADGAREIAYRGVLPGPVRDRARAGGAAHRDPGAEGRRRGLVLPEVHPACHRLGHRRRGRPGRPGRAGQHGRDPAACRHGRGGPGGRGAARRRRRARRRGHQRRRPTSAPAASTASTWPASSSPAPSRRPHPAPRTTEDNGSP